ncbi:MAG: hypothetical protein MZV70_07545 [Desulfobacterales bacterium]|nr:hypothetical protein [Desulfobacterales bacterium]
MAIYLARRFTDAPLQAIGKTFNRYHATALHSIHCIEKGLKSGQLPSASRSSFSARSWNPGSFRRLLECPPGSTVARSAIYEAIGREVGHAAGLKSRADLFHHCSTSSRLGRRGRLVATLAGSARSAVRPSPPASRTIRAPAAVSHGFKSLLPIARKSSAGDETKVKGCRAQPADTPCAAPEAAQKPLAPVASSPRRAVVGETRSPTGFRQTRVCGADADRLRRSGGRPLPAWAEKSSPLNGIEHHAGEHLVFAGQRRSTPPRRARWWT